MEILMKKLLLSGILLVFCANAGAITPTEKIQFFKAIFQDLRQAIQGLSDENRTWAQNLVAEKNKFKKVGKDFLKIIKDKKISPAQKIDDVIKDYFLPLRKEAFPVFDETKLIGFLTIQNIKGIPLSLRHKTKVKNALTPVSRFSRFKENDNLYKALVKVAGNEQAIFPVFRDKKLVGILSHSQVMSYVRTKMSLGA